MLSLFRPLLSLSLTYALTIQNGWAETRLSSPPSLTADRLFFELALTRKVLADELFLQGDRIQSVELYLGAQSDLKKINAKAEDVDGDERRLLQQEISYRKTLIDSQLGFWGSAYSRKPINPVAAYERFKTAVSEFDKLTKEVTALIDSGKPIAVINVQALEEAEKADVAALNKEKAAVRQRYNARQLNILDQQMQRIHARQKNIAQEVGKLKGQLTESKNQINSMITKSIMQAVGVPDIKTAQAVAEGKDLKEIALSAVTTALADGDSELARALSDYSETTAKAIEFYRTAETTYSKIEEFKRDASKVGQLIKSRSIGDLIKAGSIVYGRLDPESKAQFAEIAGSAELKTLVNLATEGTSLRHQVAGYLSGKIKVSQHVKSMMVAVIDDNFEEFRTLYTKMLNKISLASLSNEQQRIYIHILFRDWSKVVSQEIFSTVEVNSAILSSIGIECGDRETCATLLATELEARSIDRLPNIVLEAGRLKVSSGDQVLFERDFAEVARQVLKREVDRTKDKFLAEVDLWIADLEKLEDKFVLSVVDSLPDITFGREIEKLLSIDEPSDIKSEILAAGGSGQRDLSMEQLSSFILGSEAVTSQAKDTTSLPDDEQLVMGDIDGQGTAAETEVALSALAMTGPYGAAAVAAIKIIAAINAGHRLADRINDLYDEDKSLVVELIHLEDMAREARLSEALVDLEAQIADTQTQYALQKGQILRDEVQRQNELEQARIKIAKATLPRVFLKAELLRMYFDTLDRSLAIWAGNPAEERGYIENEIRSDPNWVRYQLDNDIGVYSWFDRTIEGERQNLNRLREHWLRLGELAKLACEKSNCDGLTTVVNEVNVTDELSLSNLLLPEDRARLATWQSGVGDAQIELPFLLRPINPLLPSHLNGVRVIDVAIAAASGDDRSALEQASLLHSGVGYIRLNDKYFRESFLPAQADTLRFAIKSDQISSIVEDTRHRWQTSNLGLKPLEGYSLYSLYILTLRREQDTRPERMKDVKLRFFYAYRQSAAPTSVFLVGAEHEAWLSCTSRSGLAQTVEFDQLDLLVSRSGIIQAGSKPERLQAAERACVVNSNSGDSK